MYFVQIFESIIKDIMLKHLIDNDLISKSQHGFLPNKSFSTNLLETIDFITEAISLGFSVDIVYTDFAKVFDKVSHQKLLHKLKSFGFGDSFLNSIQSFLSSRKQRVVLGEVNSEWVEVDSGVPHGSQIGPLLFIVYINDMLENISNGCEA